MNEVETALGFLDRLAERGRELRSSLAGDAASGATLESLRQWQTDVAVAVNELSGGSKAHWLSKAFSAAFLIATPPPGDRELVVEAPARDIVDRLLAVVAQAQMSLTQVAAGTVSLEPSAPRRFEFVHDAAVRSVLEQACTDGERALEGGEGERAFMTFCSGLEAIIPDALSHRLHGRAISELSFDERIAAAESAGLIHAGCARLPSTARRYRERRDADAPASTRDANVVRQVLHVVMRDLDPGR